MPATCEPYRDALSAMADGEVAPVGRDALAAHLATCDRCTAFAAATDDLARRLRVTAAEPVPDLTASILAAVDTPQTARARTRWGQLRVLLALTGVVQLLLAVPALVTSDLAVHATREVGIVQAAIGVGLVVAAWRPARAGGMLPVVAVVALLAVVTALVDVTTGTTSLVAESSHLLEVVGTGLLAALDRLQGRAQLRPARA